MNFRSILVIGHSAEGIGHWETVKFVVMAKVLNLGFEIYYRV
ncbi:MAG: hypothetical protein WBL95_11840 [Microcoleus sp.]